MNFATNTISVTVVGERFSDDLPKLSFFKKYTCTRYKEVLHVALSQGELWLVDYGVIVSWGLSSDDQAEWLGKIMEEGVVKPLDTVFDDHFRFELAKEREQMINDVIELQYDDILRRLAAVHALAQSIKLTAFEDVAQRSMEKMSYVPRSLAKNGKLGLSWKQIACHRGELFSVKSDIVFNYGLLDTPEFFWDHPELESLYAHLARYLEIRVRVDLLSKKLETIHEIFEMLADEQKHRHSSFLEWLIIVLIAVDIIFATIPAMGH